MAHNTKLFEKEYDPYVIPDSRWYKLEIDMENGQLLSSDIEGVSFTVSGVQVYIMFPVGYAVTNHFILFKGTTNASAAHNFALNARIDVDGSQGLSSNNMSKLRPGFTLFVQLTKFDPLH